MPAKRNVQNRGVPQIMKIMEEKAWDKGNSEISWA